jgi:hypothetical protein
MIVGLEPVENRNLKFPKPDVTLCNPADYLSLDELDVIVANLEVQSDGFERFASALAEKQMRDASPWKENLKESKGPTKKPPTKKAKVPAKKPPKENPREPKGPTKKRMKDAKGPAKRKPPQEKAPLMPIPRLASLPHVPLQPVPINHPALGFGGGNV